jgi:uncharacterized protein (DUF2252 family)
MASSVLAQILKVNRGRDPALVRLKLKRMATSAFAFFRGTDHLFAAAWNKLGPIDAGPPVLCCGDLHLENFGIFAAADGRPRFGINDFDEALVAPASFDLVRCTASIFLAAEEWGLLPIQAANMALVFLATYGRVVSSANHIVGPAAVLIGQQRHTILDLIANCAESQASLIGRYTVTSKKGTTTIALDKKHFGLKKSLRRQIQQAVESYGKKHGHKKEFKVLDVTGRIAGIGSLGVRRYSVLIRGTQSTGGRLLDIKQAPPSAALAAVRLKQPTFRGGEALRVITAQQKIQGVAARGLDVIVIGKQSYRMRDMIPDENRISLDACRKRPDRLLAAVQLAGVITGKAHLRGLSGSYRSAKQRLLQWTRGPALDAILSAAIKFAGCTVKQYEAFIER